MNSRRMLIVKNPSVLLFQIGQGDFIIGVERSTFMASSPIMHAFPGMTFDMGSILDAPVLYRGT
jgi:hypothetical protein